MKDVSKEVSEAALGRPGQAAGRPGRAKRGLDLSLGHIPTEESSAKALPPVLKRSDLFDWITEGEIADEVWAAFRGAVQWAREDDFEDQARELGMSLREGTLLDSDGVPWVERGAFLGKLCEFIYWRLLALGEERGVGIGFDNPVPPMGRDGATIRERIREHAWGKFVGGRWSRRDFKTKREAQAWMLSAPADELELTVVTVRGK
jgi:hypothetical protein